VPLVTVIMKMYTDMNVSTSVGKAKATIPSTSGVKQGDNLPRPDSTIFSKRSPICREVDLLERSDAEPVEEVQMEVEEVLNMEVK
jgi:hypothetical protein